VLGVTFAGAWSSSACHPTTAYGLHVVAPGNHAAMLIPFAFEACAKRGPAYLWVTTVTAGTGIPGYDPYL
jgi:hypothetical protein